MIGTLKTAEFQPQRLAEPGPYALEGGKRGDDFPFGLSFTDMLAAYSDKTISGVDDRRTEHSVKPEEGAESAETAAVDEHEDEEKARETGETGEKAALGGQNPAPSPPAASASEAPAEKAADAAADAPPDGPASVAEKTGAGDAGVDESARQDTPRRAEKARGLNEDGRTAPVKEPAGYDGESAGRAAAAEAAAEKNGSSVEEEEGAAEEAGFLIAESESAPVDKDEKPAGQARAADGGKVAGESGAARSAQEGGAAGSGAKNGREKEGGEAFSAKERPSKRERTVKVELRDMRTESAGGGTVSVVQEKTVVSGGGRGGETEMIVELKHAGASAGAAAEGAVKDPAAFAAFKAEKSLENFLARELHQNLNGDIVRQAQVMLRDGGEGTIRLALRPESLGSVKIRLELSENKITGKIIVETPEALRAFEQERAALEEAFRESGFAGASLDTALSGGGAGTGERREGAALSWTRTAGLGAARYDAAAEQQDEGARVPARAAYEGASIDVLA